MKEFYLLLILFLVGCSVAIPKDRTIELPTQKYSGQVIEQRIIEDGKVRVLTCRWEEEDGNR